MLTISSHFCPPMGSLQWKYHYPAFPSLLMSLSLSRYLLALTAVKSLIMQSELIHELKLKIRHSVFWVACIALVYKLLNVSPLYLSGALCHSKWSGTIVVTTENFSRQIQGWILAIHSPVLNWSRIIGRVTVSRVLYLSQSNVKKLTAICISREK